MSNPLPSPAPVGMATPLTGTDRLWETIVGNDLVFLMARATALSLGIMNDRLGAHGLKVRSYSVLALAVSETRPSQRELAEFLSLDPSQIVALVDDLESRGFVKREADPNDRRANVVVATDAGRQLFRAARATSLEADDHVFEPLPKTDRERLATELRALAIRSDVDTTAG